MFFLGGATTKIGPMGHRNIEISTPHVRAHTHTRTHARTRTSSSTPPDELPARHRGRYLHNTQQTQETTHPCNQRDSNPPQQPSSRKPEYNF